jgi:hypothetical protein
MKKRFTLLLVIIILLLIYNAPPILVLSEGIVIGKRMPDKKSVTGSKIEEAYLVTSVFNSDNQWENYYFVNTKPFDTVTIEALYLTGTNKSEKVNPFLYRMKRDKKHYNDTFKMLRNHKEYIFRFSLTG